MMGSHCLPVMKAKHLTTDGTDVGELLAPLPHTLRGGGGGRGRRLLARMALRTLPFPGGGMEQHLLQGGEGKVVRVELLLQSLLALQGPGGEVQWALHPSLLPSRSPPLSALAGLVDFVRVVCIVSNVQPRTAILLEVHLAQQMGF